MMYTGNLSAAMAITCLLGLVTSANPSIALAAERSCWCGTDSKGQEVYAKGCCPKDGRPALNPEGYPPEPDTRAPADSTKNQKGKKGDNKSEADGKK